MIGWLKRWGLLTLLVTENFALITVWFFHQWRQRGLSPVERGRRIAERLGCFTCHGPGGIKGIRFEKRPEWDCPSWDGGTAMMYVQEEKEIAEWILDGMPQRLRENHGEEDEKRLAPMPAFRGLITQKELQDLIAYWKAVSEWELPPEGSLAARGYEIAEKSGCFGCHGPGGRGSPSNPGSFKGYIPAWDSPDFEELVRDEKELEEWILEGVCERLKRNPAAQFFLRRAPIKMPAYRGYLTEEEVKAIKAYIRWLREKTRP